jgi:hypothetical protein
VDSNYDWGQDIDALEEQWAALTRANGDRPPDLVYFGFLDPRLSHGLVTGPRSWCGFMDDTRVKVQGPESHDAWIEDLSRRRETVVASISCARLIPDKTGLQELPKWRLAGRIGRCFFVYAPAEGE